MVKAGLVTPCHFLSELLMTIRPSHVDGVPFPLIVLKSFEIDK
jgi:hypothetical protein